MICKRIWFSFTDLEEMSWPISNSNFDILPKNYQNTASIHSDKSPEEIDIIFKIEILLIIFW